MLALPYGGVAWQDRGVAAVSRTPIGRRALVTARAGGVVLALLSVVMCVSMALGAARALGLSGARGTFASSGCYRSSSGRSVSYDCTGTFAPQPGSGGRAEGQAWLKSGTPLPPGQRAPAVQLGSGELDAYGFVPAIGAFQVLGLGIAALGFGIALSTSRPRESYRKNQLRVHLGRLGTRIAIGGGALFAVCLVAGMADWLAGVIS